MASRFIDEFTARTKALREKSGRSQPQMAQLLRIPKERYQKYETRTPLPHEHVVLFCALVGCDLEYLYTGRATKRSQTLQPDSVIRAFSNTRD